MQEALVEERAAGEVGDVLILTEHEPVLTVGRGGAGQDLSQAGAPVHEVERGGEARAYPISQIEYHHIVNDTIAGEPYLVTY